VRSPQEEVGHGAGEGAREGAPQWGSRILPPYVCLHGGGMVEVLGELTEFFLSVWVGIWLE